MAKYMTQRMSSGKLPPKTYYRKQTQDHVTHEESGAFTQAAKSNYARFNNIHEDAVDLGTYRSGQGIPTGVGTFEIPHQAEQEAKPSGKHEEKPSHQKHEKKP
jgi:hypothetical protein